MKTVTSPTRPRIPMTARLLHRVVGIIIPTRARLQHHRDQSAAPRSLNPASARRQSPNQAPLHAEAPIQTAQMFYPTSWRLTTRVEHQTVGWTTSCLRALPLSSSNQCPSQWMTLLPIHAQLLCHLSPITHAGHRVLRASVDLPLPAWLRCIASIIV